MIEQVNGGVVATGGLTGLESGGDGEEKSELELGWVDNLEWNN